MIRRPRIAALAAIGLVTTLGGCADRALMETDPVTIASDKGPVTCQLYRPDIVMWDEGVRWPEGMGKAQADALCRDEGRRRKKAGG